MQVLNQDPTMPSLDNPVFHIYLIAAAIMILKLMIQPWITVQRMMKVSAGYRSPEDSKKSPLNMNPTEGQTDLNEYVDRATCRTFSSLPVIVMAGYVLVRVIP